MSAMSDLAIETEELFSSNNFWADWSKIEDHGLTMYAFCGSRWSWSGELHNERDHLTVTEPYYLGGEGVRGSSPIFCGECAANFATTTGLERISNGTYTNPEDPETVHLAKHQVSLETQQEVMSCPCGNAMFSFVDIGAIMNTAKQGQITLGQALDLIYLNGYYDGTGRAFAVEYCEPLFKSGRER